MTFPGSFYVHSVVVEPLTGENIKGPVFGPGVTVSCWCEEVSRLVADQTTEEVTAGTTGAFASSTTVYAALSAKASFPVNSRVTLPSGKAAKVLQVNSFDSGSLGLGLDHIEVHIG